MNITQKSYKIQIYEYKENTFFSKSDKNLKLRKWRKYAIVYNVFKKSSKKINNILKYLLLKSYKNVIMYKSIKSKIYND